MWDPDCRLFVIIIADKSDEETEPKPDVHDLASLNKAEIEHEKRLTTTFPDNLDILDANENRLSPLNDAEIEYGKRLTILFPNNLEIVCANPYALDT